mmetsp:Transcript_927/g.2778  ORF Transcript_927/g.2778 Transcript_927/m.2778 type:complete len:285 (-) Transcript_927:505-1359(-)
MRRPSPAPRPSAPSPAPNRGEALLTATRAAGLGKSGDHASAGARREALEVRGGQRGRAFLHPDSRGRPFVDGASQREQQRRRPPGAKRGGEGRTALHIGGASGGGSVETSPAQRGGERHQAAERRGRGSEAVQRRHALLRRRARRQQKPQDLLVPSRAVCAFLLLAGAFHRHVQRAEPVHVARRHVGMCAEQQTHAAGAAASRGEQQRGVARACGGLRGACGGGGATAHQSLQQRPQCGGMASTGSEQHRVRVDGRAGRGVSRTAVEEGAHGIRADRGASRGEH